MGVILKEFEESVRETAARLERGRLLGLATDSTYAIVASIESRAGVEALRNLRAVPASKNFSILLKDLSEISRYAYLDRTAYRLVKRLTPGGYTFIFRATKDVPRLMATRQRTVGVRVCGVSMIDALCDSLGGALVSASASLGPDSYAETAYEVVENFPGIELVLDSGPKPSEPSTVIDLTGAGPKILRIGSGSIDEIEG